MISIVEWLENLSDDSRKDFLDVSSEFEDLLEEVLGTGEKQEDYKDNCGGDTAIDAVGSANANKTFKRCN